MAQLVENVQQTLKKTSSSAALITLKVLTGLVLGLTLTLIFQEIFQYGNLLFMFVIVVFTGGFIRLSRSWDWKTLLTFNLICVLVGLLLRLYVLVAPGA
jgi:hypothetical protein